MLPFPPFDPTAFTAEIDAVSRYDDFGYSNPFGLLQSDNATTSGRTGSQEALMYVWSHI